MALKNPSENYQNSKKYNTKRYVPFEVMKEMVRSYGCTCRSQWWRWYDKHQPQYMPKYPNRTYPEWESWNEFFGNDNSFGKELSRRRKITRPYWDAVRWTQVQGYKTRDDYLSHYEAGDVPDDIPKRPEQFYAEWNGWGVWLGTTIRSTVMSKSEDLNMIALCRLTNQAGNMVEVIANPDGVAALQQQVLARGDLEPFKVYHVESELKEKVTEVLNEYGSSQGGNVYIVANVHELVGELGYILREYVPGK